jgi:hypothetical protein
MPGVRLPAHQLAPAKRNPGALRPLPLTTRTQVDRILAGAAAPASADVFSDRDRAAIATLRTRGTL